MNFHSSKAAAFGQQRLELACRKAGISVSVELVRDSGLPAQAYRLTRLQNRLRLSAGDEEAAMTALLDLADSVEALQGPPGVSEGIHRPRFQSRGIKLNVPLDARTPSYSDCGDSAQDNIAAMWSEEFWRGLIDRMVLQRYNTLTLWNLCPFPSMVRVPEYPDAALEDVMISSFMAGGTSRALQFYTPEMKAGLVRIRRMTIEEKTAFWQRVFQYAADRCVKVFLFTWNLYLYGLEDSGYPLTESADDPHTQHYIRCSTAALLRAFPTLAGIGVTAGENLCSEWNENMDMHWLRNTYGRAMEDVLAENPSRDLTLICRTHQTTLSQVQKAFADFRGHLELSTKYAMAHMTACERPRFSDPLLLAKAEGQKVWLTLRQDDFYLFPWAEDTFLASLMDQMPKDDVRGFYLGADGVVWGVENQSRDPELKNRYWLDKHFYLFALVGRLGYRESVDPAERQMLLRRFLPGMPADLLERKYRHASRAVRLISLAHWRNYDFQWYPEACCRLHEPDRITVFDDLNQFLTCGACPDSGVASVAETASGNHSCPVTAEDIAGKILEEAALADAVALPEGTSAPERELRADLCRITGLARYYAFKLRASVHLLQGRHAQAADCMRQASECWQQYAAETARWYRPQRLSRLRGVVSPDMWNSRVERDAWICEEPEPITGGEKQ